MASKAIPASIVYEAADVVAFKDLTPRAPFHVLVIPRTHVAKLSELEDEALGGKLLQAARTVAKNAGTRRQLPAGREQRRQCRPIGVASPPPRPRRQAVHVAAGLAEPDRRVIIVEPKASWPSEFDAISRSLPDALGPLAPRIDPISSTAVPGLPAKDLIDIQVTVVRLDRPRLLLR